jgi:TolB-like protein/DNA-binding winged helix-turn-helix (wHTH) protein/Tfp pilus assembly protein PilF
MSLMEKEIYEFGDYLLDPAERILSRQGSPVSLTPKAFETLLCLVRCHGRVVTKDELLKRIWPGVFVEEVNLAVNISTIRKALGESPQDCRFIATVPGRGYRFVAEVRKIVNRCLDDANASITDPKAIETEPLVPSIAGEIKADHQEQKSLGRIRRFLRSLVGTGSALKLAAIGLFLLLLTLPIGVRLRRPQNQKVSSSEAHPSIAVLPFADLSPAKDQEYFSEGLAEELITELTKVPGLKVAARSSTFQFKGRNEDVRTIGKKLGVTNILEGSVQRQGDRVRIRVELTKADDGIELWSETYDRKVGEIFSVQDEIARAATNALQVKLLGSTRNSTGNRGTSQEAYEAYLEGQYFFGRGDSKAGLDRALVYANKAINLEPKYAPAWALRSRVWSFMADYDLTAMSQSYRQAREDAEHAIVLDPGLAAAYLALGWIQMDDDWDWSGAEASLAKAADLEPGNADVLYCTALLYEIQGRLPEAIETQKRAISLDPLQARSYSQLGYQLYFAGHYDEADTALEKALELNPQKEQDHITRGELLLASRHAQEALAEMEREPEKNWKLFGEALAYYALGRIPDSDAALKRLIGRGENSWACQIAQIYAYRGEHDKAFEWLDRAYQLHDGGLPYIKVDYILTKLRQDPRYSNLLQRMRLPT